MAEKNDCRHRRCVVGRGRCVLHTFGPAGQTDVAGPATQRHSPACPDDNIHGWRGRSAAARAPDVRQDGVRQVRKRSRHGRIRHAEKRARPAVRAPSEVGHVWQHGNHSSTILCVLWQDGNHSTTILCALAVLGHVGHVLQKGYLQWARMAAWCSRSFLILVPLVSLLPAPR